MAIMMAWPEIESFHNIRKYTHAHPEILQGTTTVVYKAKIKMHGTNAAVQVHTDGTVVAQSRENIITPEKDNAGFARWVKEHEYAWQMIGRSFVIYGEWFGPGIQKGVACSEIPKKSFAVFAIRYLNENNEPTDELVVEPEEISKIMGDSVPDTYVLPWYTNPSIDTDGNQAVLATNWEASPEGLALDVKFINQWVLDIEANDPWIEATFGVKGTGEGLVFYPTSQDHLGYENFKNLVFKAKGEKHKNIKSASPAQVDPSVASGIDAFVDMVLTEARLEQGATKVSPNGALTYDMKLTGKYVSWVVGDVEKETQDELAASNLTWKQVQKPISDKARAWYLNKAKTS